ncbi:MULTISPECIES: hypothetical protein [Rhodomicrobium]|uniref:hypothetical protein n=1 Tax=Rhodomicrobium TaxID=1068 RepID=UPI000B4B74D5|nr:MULTISPECIES: hypothetical protein [Rhodomicrobium]
MIEEAAPDRASVLRDILLLEYEKLKDEQRARITIRENLLYIALIVFGAVFSTLFTMAGFDIGYLVLTPVLFVISNAYYYNDEMISRSNLYIRTSLAPRLAAATGLPAHELFGWEGFVRRTRRVRRRFYLFVANLTLYPAASGAALIFFVSRRPQLSRAEELSVLICGLVTLLMLIQVVYYADLFTGRED